ncbi:hypothetical protein GINT2_001983 [Glugoides intestinalis]
MFFSQIPEDEDEEKYSVIQIDEHKFYFEKPVEKKQVQKRRYSDQFKDPLFVSKDTYRKLNMLKQFREKYKDINIETDKYILCIGKCILILKKEFFIDPVTIFKAFDLTSLGIIPEDFGIEDPNHMGFDN